MITGYRYLFFNFLFLPRSGFPTIAWRYANFSSPGQQDAGQDDRSCAHPRQPLQPDARQAGVDRGPPVQGQELRT